MKLFLQVCLVWVIALLLIGHFEEMVQEKQ